MTAFGIVLGGYVLLVLGLGAWSARRADGSAEGYFLAGRGLSRVVLFMALFGTNCTAFVLVGVPGRAYHDGVATFGLNAPIVALGIPLTFWAIGAPARRMGLQLNALTPTELYSRRLDSRAVGQLLFVFYLLYTLPYMVTAVDGAARTLQNVTHGAVGEMFGGVCVLAVALLYTSLGGMRATAWTNVVQGALFLGFMVSAFFLVSSGFGGLGPAMRAVEEVDPALLRPRDTGLFEPRAFASWSLAISFTVIGFPHMLVRLMAARSERDIQLSSRLYPVALVLLWVPAVLLGVWGRAAHPGLEGRASDRVFALLVSDHMPDWVGAFGFVAVLAAVMSTLDAQLLTLGSMATRDVLPHAEPDAGPAPGQDARDVRNGRLFGVLVAVLTFGLWRALRESIFATASIAFSGYVVLVPLLFLGVRWRRFNAGGAFASLLVGNGVYFLALGATDAPLARAALSPAWLGLLPVVWGFLGGAAAAWVGSVLTAPTRPERVAEAFAPSLGSPGRS